MPALPCSRRAFTLASIALTATMLREGKPPVENWVVAGAKP